MSTTPSLLPNFSATVLVTDEVLSIGALAGDKAIVIDFWTTKCVRCPAALSRLNEEAPNHDGAAFFSCVLDNKEIAVDVVDGEWENLTHLYVDSETKDNLKLQFQFSQVPFCIIADKNLKVLAAGSPKDIDLCAALATGASEVAASSNGLLVFDEDF